MSRVTFQRPVILGRWEKGFHHLPDECAQVALDMWQIPVDILYDRSQQYVHILSGDLKATGRTKISLRSRAVVGDVIYGGGPASRGADGKFKKSTVDYAVYEHERGGEHAFLTRAFEAAGPLMERTMPEIYDRVVSSWR